MNDPLRARGGDSTGYSCTEAGTGINPPTIQADIAFQCLQRYLSISGPASIQLSSGQYNYGLLNIDYRQYVSLKNWGDRRLVSDTEFKNAFEMYDHPASLFWGLYSI
ncbi:MAG: hypothetical protein IPH20_27505 [Bacteroidales bacterium]|nr:hypothetical protein [Bacteroidales bacterium]